MNNLHYFASAGAGSDSLLGPLGIDWRLFVLQTVAFAVLLLVLKKWVYPPILAMLDERDESIKEGLEAAEQAKKAASESEKRTAAMLKKAQQESRTIVATAKNEAAEMVAEAEQKDLRNQMVDLVVDTTRKVTLDTVDPSKDTSLIKKQLEEIK